MNIEIHINNLKQYIKDDEIIEKDGSDFANFCKGHIDDIQAVLNELDRLKKYEELEWQEFNELAVASLELQKKDKVIDEMAEKLVEAHGWFYSEFDNYTKEEWKEYFYKKVSE